MGRFAEYCQLFIEESNGIYNVSKVKIGIEDGKININTENVMIEPFLNILSRATEKTIMFDNLPTVAITIRVKDASLEDVLNLAIVKLPGFGLERISSGYYISKNLTSNSSKRNIDIFTLSESDGVFSIAIQKASFSTIIDALFKKMERNTLY